MRQTRPDLNNSAYLVEGHFDDDDQQNDEDIFSHIKRQDNQVDDDDEEIKEPTFDFDIGKSKQSEQ